MSFSARSQKGCDKAGTKHSSVSIIHGLVTFGKGKGLATQVTLFNLPDGSHVVKDITYTAYRVSHVALTTA